MKNIIKKIEEAGLVGRGGAEFPTALKWKFVKQVKHHPKYVVCNASEGELGLCKDIYILEHFPETVIKGITIAMDFLKTKYAYFNFNQNYYEKVRHRIDALIRKYQKKGYILRIFKEKPSYIGGEETALLNAIEEKRVQPRIKPPYPSAAGLFGQPTLIHNVETLFNVAKVLEGTFENKRFYAIWGKNKSSVVHYLPADWSIEKLLRKTGNMPKFDFFVQIGGSASGLVINRKQMQQQKMIGAGSIEIYPKTIKPRNLLLKWFAFYKNESCGKCTPCREGTFQLYQMIKKYKRVPWKNIMALIDTLEETSFCALGQSIAVPVKSYLKNILDKKI